MDVTEEFDLEVDVEDLPPNPLSPDVLGAPSVIVDNLHVTYRVLGVRKPRGAHAKPLGRVKRLFRRVVPQTGGVTDVHAVRGVSFVAHHGESIGIVGTNGSGKSTMLRALAGLHQPSEGSVYVSGVPSLLGVSAVLMKRLSGAQNILIGGLALGLTQSEIEERFDEIVDFADIGDFVHLPMSTYSNGMAARLRFAISTAATPDVLMIDEALATGDAGFRERSRQRIDKIRQEAGTVFVVTHSSAALKTMCNRVIWLDKGEIVMDGPAKEVTAAYRAHTRRVAKGRRR